MAWKSTKLITIPLFNDQLSSFLLFIEQMNPYLWVILSYGPWSKTDSIQQLQDFTPSNNSTFHSCFFEHVNCEKALFQTFFFTFKSSIFFLGPAHTIQLKRQCQTKGPRIAIRWRKSNTSVLIFRQSLVKFTTCTTSYYCQKLLGILQNSKGKRIALPVSKSH